MLSYLRVAASFVGFVFLLNSNVQGQELTSSSRSPALEPPIAYRWDVSTDLLPLIGKNTLPNYSVMVRRGIGHNQALRFRLGTELRRAVTTNDNFKSNVLLQLGYEFQRPVSNKVQVFGGLDLVYRKKDTELIALAFLGGTNSVSYPDTERTTGFVGFAGVKVFVLPSLSLSIENTLSLVNVRNYVNNYMPTKPVVTGGGITFGDSFVLVSRTAENTWEVFLTPIQVLNLSYHF